MSAAREQLIANGTVKPAIQSQIVEKNFVVVLNLPEGRVAVQTPKVISKESVEDVRNFLALILNQMERATEA